MRGRRRQACALGGDGIGATVTPDTVDALAVDALAVQVLGQGQSSALWRGEESLEGDGILGRGAEMGTMREWNSTR